MGEQADDIRAPGLEDESPPPGDSGGDTTAGTEALDVETERVRLDRETVEKTARAGLELIGNYLARTNGEPRLKFTPDELETGATIWTDVFEAFFPDWMIPPKWAAAFSAGMWTFSCYKARQPIFEDMRKQQVDRQQRSQVAQAELNRLREEEKRRNADAADEGGEDDGEGDGGDQ